MSFDWREDGTRDIGLIAEEVGEVVPEVVEYEENGHDAKSADYARLVPLLVESIKEQQQDAALAELNARMARVEAELNELQGTAAPWTKVEQKLSGPFYREVFGESN